MYSNGESERIVGKALKKYGIPRSKVVILSKIFNPVNDGKDERLPAVNDGENVNQMGLSRKHIFTAVDNCLKRLDTDYIGEPPPPNADPNCPYLGLRLG
jgi:aryl-alcohol dehydrogenase-like predicted oxidoreductase